MMARYFVGTLGGVLLAIQCIAPIAAQEVSGESGESLAIQAILKNYCYDCHADGASEGDFSLDALDLSQAAHDRAAWWNVLKNVRADIMPPVMDAEAMRHADKLQLLEWIKLKAFAIDPENPDPGRVTVRRLNRAEYRNTIRDLMGIDFNAEVVFPPDNTGFGFDNVGDALTLSPLLMEKYLQSATKIVEEAVPTECKVIPTIRLTGGDFRSADARTNGGRLSYDKAAIVRKMLSVPHSGRYALDIEVRLHGSFDFDPSRCKVTFFDGEEALYSDEYEWDERKSIEYHFVRDWDSGDHELRFELEPLPNQNAKEEMPGGDTYVNFHILHVNATGPLDGNIRVHPHNYERFFPADEPPTASPQRREYARKVLEAFATRAFRHPVDEKTLSKLVAIAEATFQNTGKSFEAGVAQAMTAILASPRFLFRFESPSPDSQEVFPLVDEYGLASRLSYLLWSTMPDAELMRLAGEGRLRENLDAQVQRLLKDERADGFVRNFVGQWLRSRDVEHVSLDPLVALGFGEEYDQLRSVFRRRFRTNEGEPAVSDEEWEKARNRFGELREIRDKFDGDARRAMRQETEMHFEYIVRNDRSLLELLDCNYAFLNDKLADLYGIPEIEGSRMRRIDLPPNSARGGVLTQGTMLTVTSNPTRTSSVKRGLFILDNILGTPAPPAPPNVPELEASQDRFDGREPTLRELLAVHREAALCSSCHSRMDPLGLALENFNALGMWRDSEHGQAIDVSGQLVTGESFANVQELKKVLTSTRRQDFYRCVTQKLLTYALGRGLDYYDEFTVDQIVERLDANGGRFSVLLSEVIHSAPFQRMRRPTGLELTTTP